MKDQIVIKKLINPALYKSGSFNKNTSSVLSSYGQN